eukprot:m.69488 g.69488  ORF g.69488 m.69488 type:complete len:106 (-) comp9968_c0_seq2:348-665(-)
MKRHPSLRYRASFVASTPSSADGVEFTSGRYSHSPTYSTPVSTGTLATAAGPAMVEAGAVELDSAFRNLNQVHPMTLDNAQPWLPEERRVAAVPGAITEAQTIEY